ncbi:MAG: serine/threonine protein kinase [Lachnospiraceae bacterium]|nr:serine/threonine protein kinase [Lachnospiraceae bacterium]
MEQSEIGKICLRCMKVSDEPEICPFCGKEKAGQQTWSKALAPGTILNQKILIGNILGKGGYGITYIGYDMLLEYPVAVKEFFPDEMVDRADDGKTVLVLDAVNTEEYEKETKAYLREARILAEFSKFPGIVAIKDLFYENNTGYLIMEYLQSGNLRKYIDSQGGWLPVDDSLRLMEPVISILGKLHQSGLIHRDISPDNIMMDGDGSIKLIDFGGSRKMGFANQQVFLGKWGFAPLEQMLSKLTEQGPWTDIYGICATLYCMMTGDIPQSSYERNEKDELVNLADYTIQIDKKTAAAIMKGLSMKPEDRQQSIEELYKDLYGCYPDEKNAPTPGRDDNHILKDRNGRVWFGAYPMNEITGSQLTSDLVYAEYDKDDVAVVEGERYLRLPVYKENVKQNDIFSVVKKAMGEDSELAGYRYFKFNMLSWKIVGERAGRVTLQSEYIIDYKLFDDVKYAKMNDKEISKVRSGIYWEDSKIREWLNSVFVRRTFSEDERTRLNVTKISTTQSGFSDRITYDKVYLPSIEEIRYGFDMVDLGMGRSPAKEKRELDLAPCSQYVAAKSGNSLTHSSYALRSRGHIEGGTSYKCAENYEGHAMVDNKLTEWKLNKGMGIRPIICVNEADIVEMV